MRPKAKAQWKSLSVDLRSRAEFLVNLNVANGHLAVQVLTDFRSINNSLGSALKTGLLKKPSPVYHARTSQFSTRQGILPR